MVHLCLCFPQSVSLSLTLFLVCDCASLDFLFDSVFLSSTVLDCVSKDAESISGSQVPEKLSSKSVQRH